jgi:hypothetical protein
MAFGGCDQLQPIAEYFRGRELPHHISVIQVTMRIDQTWKEDRVTEIKRFIPLGLRQVTPASNFGDAVAGD